MIGLWIFSKLMSLMRRLLTGKEQPKETRKKFEGG